MSIRSEPAQSSGLTALSEAEQSVQALTGSSALNPAVVVAPQEGDFKEETVEFKVAPRGWVEHKYRLDRR